MNAFSAINFSSQHCFSYGPQNLMLIKHNMKCLIFHSFNYFLFLLMLFLFVDYLKLWFNFQVFEDFLVIFFYYLFIVWFHCDQRAHLVWFQVLNFVEVHSMAWDIVCLGICFTGTWFLLFSTVIGTCYVL